MREIRNRFRFIPFGKFSLSGRGRPPFNQVFVGRQKERTNFIELLTHQEQFGAFLISGQRGAGKTSFVEYCLSEYEKMAFQRSIRTSRSSHTFNFLLLFGILAIITSVFVLFTQGMELLSQNAFETVIADVQRKKGVSPEFIAEYASDTIVWVWAPLFFGSLLSTIMVFFAWRGISASAEFGNTPVERTFYTVIAALPCLLLPLLWFTFSDFSAVYLDPDKTDTEIEALSSFYPYALDINNILLTLLFFIATLSVLGKLVQDVAMDAKTVHGTSHQHMTNVVICSFAIAVVTVIGWLLPGFNIGNAQNSLNFFQFLSFLTFCFSLKYLLKQTLDLHGRFANRFLLGLTTLITMIAFLAFQDTSSNVFSANLNSDDWLPTLCLKGIILVILGFAIYGPINQNRKTKIDLKDEITNPPIGPIRTLLVFKSLLLSLLTLICILPMTRAVFVAGKLNDVTWSERIFDFLPLASQTHLNFESFLIILTLIILIYRAEYIWIARDLRSHRQDNSLGLLERSPNHPIYASAWNKHSNYRESGSAKAISRFIEKFLKKPRTTDGEFTGLVKPTFANKQETPTCNPLELPPDLGFKNDKSNTAESTVGRYSNSYLWTRRRFVFRQLEQATFVHLVYNIRYPVLKIWINLGFDNLGHSRIVEAMLRQLKTHYYRKFLSLKSIIGVSNIVILFAFAIMMTGLLSRSLFHVGNLSDFKGHREIYTYKFEGRDISSLPNFGQTNYCGFFEVYPELAPNIKSFVCALPFSNSIMELLYSPVLEWNEDFMALVPKTSAPLDSKENKIEQPQNSKLVYESIFLASSKKLNNRPTNNSQNCWLYDSGMRKNTLSFLVYEAILPDKAMLDRCMLFELVKQDKTETEPNKKTTDEFEKGNPIEPLLSRSGLSHYILDQNIGLPFLDYSSENPALEQASWNSYEAYSPYERGDLGPPTFRAYHIVLYLFSFWFFFTLNRRIGIISYSANYDKINELIMLIHGVETLKASNSGSAGWLAKFIPVRKKERTVETPVDARVVEQRFIELLANLRPYQPTNKNTSVPWFEIRPEITFIFDEMDKLSGKNSDEESGGKTEKFDNVVNSQDRARSGQLHKLLADMKRLISDGSARFIFIGGRLYHDEWLADQAQRLPILNSIFSGQIYIPSLMADRRHGYGRFNDRVIEFFTLMYRNSRHRLQIWADQRKYGLLSTVELTDEPTYAQFDLPYSGHPRRAAALAHHTGMRVLNESAIPYTIKQNEELILSEEGKRKRNYPAEMTMSLGEQETLEQFVNFLTYRSAGNPKKLKELLQSLMSPSSFAMALPRFNNHEQATARWKILQKEAHDIIVLDDNALYRVQFVDMLYRHLTDHMEGKMLSRDDKVSMSIFYLMDFLLKFHNRGFSRTNLQRVDELSHIHRAPDLRSVMNTLVSVSSERFLHRVLNGVYSLRFRSDFAKEIDYLSRISKEEMATLNFTLDESQSLKTLYESTIDTGEKDNIDTIAGLGELYDYDQEHEIARNYYRKALSLLDAVQFDNVDTVERTSEQEQNSIRKSGNGTKYKSHRRVELKALGELLSATPDADQLALLLPQLPWIAARVRLVLQIGQTYEQEQNYERAVSVYMHASALCDQVLNTFAQQEGYNTIYNAEDSIINPPRVIENLAIFYQAALAAAWIKEKDPESVDESITYAESWLQNFYARENILLAAIPKMIEFHRFQKTSGNILIQCSLNHDRLGDLYFFKGKMSLSSIQLNDIILYLKRRHLGFNDDTETTGESSRNGYLDKAHYHYSVALWQIRKFLTHRHRVSGKSWNIHEDEPNPFSSIGVHPTHVHTTLADILTDLSEVLFAKRASLALSIAIADEQDESLPLLRDSPNSVFLGDLTFQHLHAYHRYMKKSINKAVDKFNQRLIVENEQFRKWMHEGDNKLLPKDKDEWGIFEGKASHLSRYMEKYLPDGGVFQTWIGDRNEISSMSEFRDKTLLQFEHREPHMHNVVENIYAYKFFAHAAARANHKSGMSTNAANEFLLQAEAFISVLWNSRILDSIRDHKSRPDDITSERRRQFIKKLNLKHSSEMEGVCGAGDAKKFNLGMIAYGALQDALERIRFTERPSVVRMASNHGNPKRIGELFGDATDRKTANEELHTDYDLSQAWRDDPRVINLSCSLVLSLLSDQAGPLSTGLALFVYKEILVVHARETFDVRLIDDLKSFCALKSALGNGLKEDLVQQEEIRKQLHNVVTKGLYITLERMRYPILNRLNGLKVLADNAILSEGKRFSQSPLSPVEYDDCGKPKEIELNRKNISFIGRLVRELVATAEVYGSEMHFPSHRIGTTMALTFLLMKDNNLDAIYDDLLSETPEKGSFKYYSSRISKDHDPSKKPSLSDTVLTFESVGEFAINRLKRSQENSSMGRAYYENIAYMQYLNDDFNDRSVHFYHAISMANSDTAEVLSLFVKDGLKLH